MLNKEKVQSALAQYKYAFPDLWKNEQYKWKAVKWFQDNWDIKAKDFAAMLERALDPKKIDNLLASRNNFPAQMIVIYAKADPKEVKAMFRSLYDESKDLVERVADFKQRSDALLKAYKEYDTQQHYQRENAIMTYLWLRYPDKYYIYKFSEVATTAKVFETNFTFKSGAYSDNIRNFIAYYDELNAVIKEDKELVDMFRSSLTADCYPDPELKTLTIDAGFYWGRFFGGGNANDEDEDFLPSTDTWEPSVEEYSPGFTKEDWLKLLNDKDIIGPIWGGVLAAFYAEADGAATCKQIAQKYGKTFSSINSTCMQLAVRIHKKTNCPLYSRESGKKAYWPILFQGKNADAKTPGVFIWKLRPELYAALTEFEILRFQWPFLSDAPSTSEAVNYWWLNANPGEWSFSKIKEGEAEDFSFYNGKGNKRAIFRNFTAAKPGDLVIGYESSPTQKIVALLVVSEVNAGDSIFFKKMENLENPISYKSLKDYTELVNAEPFRINQGTLFKLEKDEYDFILNKIRETNPAEKLNIEEVYTRQNFLDEVFMKPEDYDRLQGMLRRKMNIVLKGAPGVGKTFAAKRLAYSMMGKKDESRVKVVQFHQNYTYEDFVMGYRPDGNGFTLTDGVFYQFCLRAKENPDQDYFFIIDEINRGNISKIFGELLMLIEKGYRGPQNEILLAYNGEPFFVPENLYIIGMMNTSDRSLAMIDYALRRRFGFFDMKPGFESDGFKKYQKKLGNSTFNKLIEQILKLNEIIEDDKSLGPGFQIGHSYFCECDGKRACTDDWMKSIVDFEIIPLLEEYWIDNSGELKEQTKALYGVFE